MEVSANQPNFAQFENDEVNHILHFQAGATSSKHSNILKYKYLSLFLANQDKNRQSLTFV